MVQLRQQPPKRRFDTKVRPQRSPVKNAQAPRRYSRTQLLRYRLLILKVRIKVFFIKAKRRPRLSAGVMASIVILASVGIIFFPRKAQSVTELEYYQQQLARVKDSVQIVKEQNPTEAEAMEIGNQIENYKDALVDGLGACDEIDTQAEQTNKDVMKDYLEAIAHARQFCSDYEDVADYARKVSKATKQLIVQSTDPLLDQSSTTVINDMVEIIGYTRSDLEKLKGGAFEDPALEEMIITIDNLQKLALETQKTPSAANRSKLAEEVKKQQHNLLRSRVYFWVNTIRVDALDRSLTRLSKEFNSKD
jgi:hypothetical protein